MSLTITLEQDEALVLFDLLASGILATKVEVPERNVLRALEALLEKQLAAPLSKDYAKLLKSARESVLDRYGSS